MLHLGEAVYAYRLASKLGLKTASLWALQTSIVGPSGPVLYFSMFLAWLWLPAPAPGLQEAHDQGQLSRFSLAQTRLLCFICSNQTDQFIACTIFSTGWRERASWAVLSRLLYLVLAYAYL